MSGYLQGNELAASQKPAANAPAPASAKSAATKAVTIHTLAQLRAAGERIAMLTCYDASYRYYWTVLQRARLAGLTLPEPVAALMNAGPAPHPMEVL